MNGLLQDESVRQGIMDFIKGLTDIATRSLNMVSAIAEKMPLISKVTGAVGKFLDGVQSAIDSVASAIQSAIDKFNSWKVSSAERRANLENTYPGQITYGKKAVGMPYVPQDDDPVLLHKGERVLTAQENRQYKNGGSNVSIPKLADTIVVREEADITKIANKLVQKINQNKMVYGGAY